jgi:hypothetical protein
MTEPNQYDVPTNASDRDKLPNPGRFEKFSDSERWVLGEALRELLQVKKEAMAIANADLGSDPRNHFTEHDFGIPELERMMDELEDAP